MAKVQLDAVLRLVDVQINQQVFRKISQQVAGMPASLQKTSVAMQGVNTSTQAANRSLSKTGQQLNTNERAARLFLQRMSQFAILLPTFATMNRALQGSIKFLFEFDSALRDIVRVDVSGLKDRMEEIGDAALTTAVKYGVLASEVLETTKIFVQAGLTIEDSQKRAELAIQATQVSTLSAANAVEFFIAASNQFKLSNEGLASALDALVKVEDLAAVEAQDVAEAFRTGGNSFAQFGKSIYDSIGLISALREQTRKSGREIGTFFKTLQTRIFAEGESRSAVEALGISVEGAGGELRPTLAVLKDLKQRFDGLTEAQQANAAKAIAGVRQFESLIATINSLGRANDLASKASKAAGAVEEKRTVTDEKLERQIGRLISESQRFAEALGDAGLQDSLSDVLKIATAILKTFTSFNNIIEKLGGNITPLLALSGVTLGRSVFGLAGNVAGRGTAPTAPGGAGAGPAAVQAAATSQSLQQLSTAANTTTAALKVKATAQGASIIASKQHTTSIQGDTTSLQAHLRMIAAVMRAQQSQISSTNTAARTQTVAATQSGNAMRNVGIVAATLGATVLPALTNQLAKLGTESGTLVGAYAAEASKIVGAGGSMALQFSIISKKAAGVAGVFGTLLEVIPSLIDAIDINLKARGEIAKGQEQARGVGAAKQLLTGTGQAQETFQALLLETLRGAVKNVEVGKDLSAALNAGLKEASAGFADPEALTQALFGDMDTLATFIENNAENIKRGVVKNEQSLNTFNELLDLVATRSNRNIGPAFSKLLELMGALEPQISKVSGEIMRGAKEWDAFEKQQEIKETASSLRAMAEQLSVLRGGAEAFADPLARLQNELANSERAYVENSKVLGETFTGLFRRLGEEFTVGLNPEGMSVGEFFTTIRDGVTKLDPEKWEKLISVIDEVSSTQEKGLEEELSLFKKYLEEEIAIQNKRNEVQSEVSKRQKALLEAESQAALAAFASIQNFNAELKTFGQSVDTDVLQQFQDISLIDVDEVLAGASELSPALQELIRNTLGGDVSEAQTALQAVADQTAAKMAILEKRLEMVNAALEDESKAADIASNTAEKRSIELEIEQAKQAALIDSTKAKVKVLEEEREAAEKAAEAERKRQELLEKLKDASRKFSTELAEVQRSFEKFAENKITDLLDQEADAQSKLKDAQQEVLDSTRSLSEAYYSLLQAQLDFNGMVAEARIKSNMLARDIADLTGKISTFDGELSFIDNSFSSVLQNANISLAKRIELERQLADETLSFLQQARDSIVQAGMGVFGQTSTENQALGKGIAGLQFVADQLGGSFESFLSLTEGQLTNVSQTLLALPAEFRQQILSALSFLPSTTNIGGFSVEQLQQAIGQVGAGVAPEVGLPSIEELNNQQVEQLTKLQELAIQDAQLQIGQVISAQRAVEAAEEQLSVSRLMQERTSQELQDVRMAVVDEMYVLEAANQERRELTNAIIATDDKNTLEMIQREAELFAEQNKTFWDVGDALIKGISSAIGSKLSVIEAANNLRNAAKGFIPNYAGGNLSPSEAAGLLQAAAREKQQMPAGAGLAVANTKEAIIPMHNRGFVPNFQEGNASPIAAGISAIKSINETVVAAIARSVTSALTDLQTGGGKTEELLQSVIDQLLVLNDSVDTLNESSVAIQSSVESTAATGTTTQTTTGTQDVRITLQTNQNNTVTITGLESLRDQITAAVRDAANEQVDSQLTDLLTQLDAIFVALQERGILSAFGQTR